MTMGSVSCTMTIAGRIGVKIMTSTSDMTAEAMSPTERRITTE
jgi:hypothetical protein